MKRTNEQTQPNGRPVTTPSYLGQSPHAQPTEPRGLNERILNDLAGKIGDKFTDLAINLGFENAEIENFRADYRLRKEQTFQMLKTWWQRWDHLHDADGSGARDALCDALEKTGSNDLVPLVKGSVDGAGHFDPNPYRDEFIKYYQDEMSVVPLLPWLPSEVRRINDIYVKLKLQERQDKTGRAVQGDVDSHEDMLNLKYEDGKPVRFILLSGIAGSGKTTIVSKIAIDWAEQKPGSQLSKFRFLVSLSMRELKGVSDLTEAIYDQILAKDTKLGRQSLTAYLRDNAKEVLVVLDGADEYNKEGTKLPSEGFIIDIISNKIFRGCTVIVTTRPHMVDKLYKLNHSFIHIETRGFSDEGVKEYIQRFFKREDPKVSVGLFGYLKASQTLLSLGRTPIMLLLMCLVWSDEQKLPETLTELFKEALLFILKRHFQKSGLPNPEDKELLENQLRDLLQTLGKEALNSLMLLGEKLVFEAGDFGNSEVVDRACKIGILSKEKTRSKLRAVESVTFFHKTFQEAIAGFFWASLVESDDELFEFYLSKVYKSNALDMEYLMRFCCGWNVKAAESLLRHVETFGLKTKEPHDPDYVKFQDSNWRFKILWILMHFEARSEELHSIAETIFNYAFLVTMDRGNDFTSAVKFLVERAASSGQSFLTKLKQVMIQGAASKEETSLATDILRYSPEVTDVFISADGKDEEVLNEACLGEALSEMQSLEKLEVNGSSGLNSPKVSAIINHLSKSRTSLKTLKLNWCTINCKDWAIFIMHSQIRELSLDTVFLQDYESPQELTDIQIGTTTLEALKITSPFKEMDILRLVKSYPNLKSLRLESVVFNFNAYISPVCNLLSTASKLRVVDLECVSFCGNSFTSLAEQLKSLKELHELNLTIKELGWLFNRPNEIICSLAREVLPSLCNLRVLHVGIALVNESSVNTEAFLAVMQWVCASPSMYALTLQCTSGPFPQLDFKSKSDSVYAVDAMHQPTQGSLQKLTVVGISLGPYMAAFIELLKQMPLLKKLDMRDMRLEESHWTELMEVLKGCQQLQKLNLSQNSVKNSVLQGLLKIIPRLPNLQQLVLPGLRGRGSGMVRDCLRCQSAYGKYCKQEIEALVSVVERQIERR